MGLSGAEGAKRVIARHEAAAFTNVPAAAFDVDTPDDYRALLDAQPFDSVAEQSYDVVTVGERGSRKSQGHE